MVDKDIQNKVYINLDLNEINIINEAENQPGIFDFRKNKTIKREKKFIDKLVYLNEKKSDSSYLFWKNQINQIKSFNNYENKTFLLVGHHYKIKKLLFPIKNNDDKKYVGLANCFCLSISIKANKLTIFVVFQGFPDCINKYYYIKRSSDFYKYFDVSGLKQTIVTNKKNINILLVRHGNSMHNMPLNMKRFYYRPLDSSLTPLGIYQSHLLAKELLEININKNIILIASNLTRSQHTGIQIIKTIKYGKLDTNLFYLEKYFKRQMVNRIIKHFNKISFKKKYYFFNYSNVKLNNDDKWNEIIIKLCNDNIDSNDFFLFLRSNYILP
jgi:hypothetical protein